MSEKKDNGLKLKSITTDVTETNSRKNIADWGNIDDLLSRFNNQNAFFVAYLDYKVVIGCFGNKKFSLPDNETFDPKFTQKIRIFDEDKELYLWRTAENTFSYRLRVDTEGEKMDVVEAHQVLWGTDVERREDGWSEITEERGTKLIVPFDVKTEKDLPLRLKTRNYIDYNDNCQAGYVDCRFVAFTDKKRGILTCTR